MMLTIGPIIIGAYTTMMDTALTMKMTGTHQIMLDTDTIMVGTTRIKLVCIDRRSTRDNITVHLEH